MDGNPPPPICKETNRCEKVQILLQVHSLQTIKYTDKYIPTSGPNHGVLCTVYGKVGKTWQTSKICIERVLQHESTKDIAEFLLKHDGTELFKKDSSI